MKSMTESLSAPKTWEKMARITEKQDVRNFSQLIDMSTDWEFQTQMFPENVLRAYSHYNLEHAIAEADRGFFNKQRGGSQGDYRQGMQKKIANVVSCLNEFPSSKRAVIMISNNPFPDHHFDDDAKCMREIHFYLENHKLNATVFFSGASGSDFS